MKFNKRNYFTPEEDAYILANYKTMKYKDIGKHLGRPEVSINSRLAKLGKFKRAPYKDVTKSLHTSSVVVNFGFKNEPYYTEAEALSCPYYNPLELVAEEKQILKDLHTK